MKVLFVSSRGGAKILAAVRDRGHEITTVIDTDPADGNSAGSLRQVAGNWELPLRTVSALSDPGFVAETRAAGTDLLLSVRSRRVVPAALLEAPRFGSYNLHTGPLPRYAGINIISWAIYNGETEHGVTVHRMVPEIDRGPIAFESRFPILADDTALTVTERSMRAGLPLIEDLLTALPAGEVRPRPSAGGEFRYFSGKDRPDLAVDWSGPSERLVNLSRACAFHPFPSPWGSPVTTHRGRPLAILRMRKADIAAPGEPGAVVATAGKAAVVATGDHPVCLESFLIDGQAVDATDLLSVGDRLGQPG